MRKFISMFLAFTMVVSMVAFANDDSDILKNTAKLYEKEVTDTAEAIMKDGGNPDISKAEFLLWIDPTYIKNSSFKDSVSYMFVYIPDAETEDIYAADFNQKGLNVLGKNFTFNGKLNLLYSGNTLGDIASVENAKTVMNICLGGRIAFLAYYVGTDTDNYIIVYDKFDDSKYNVQELEIEFGKAYTEKEFVELIKKEAEVYADYLKEQRKNEKSNVIYRDEKGDVRVTDDEAEEHEKNKWENAGYDTNLPCPIVCSEEHEHGLQRPKKVFDCDCDKPDCENEDCREDAAEDKIKKEKKEKKKKKIKTVNEYGVFKGDGSGDLKEDNYITRAEFAVVICNMLGIKVENELDSDEMDFDDVSDKHWAKEYIKAARKAGFISGRGGNKFDPDAVVSCEEATKMIVAAMGYTPLAEQKGGYPYGYAEVAAKIGMMEDLSPKGKDKVTRGDVMEMVYNSLDVPFMLQKSFGQNVEYEIADGKNGNAKTLRILLEVPIPQ